MKRILIVLLAVCLLCIFGAAAADDDPVLGKPFPDFRVTDLDRNEYSLSGMLADHEAVLINLWASWCGPCERQFPLLNEVYAQYGDRVAFIGVTIEPEDSWETIRLTKIIQHIDYPEIREEGTGIMDFLVESRGTPTTIIVDRFGNVVYIQAGVFKNSAELVRLLDVFLGEDYTGSVPLKEIPLPPETRALPLSAARRLWVENEDARRVILRLHYEDEQLNAMLGERMTEGWVVPGDTARLAMEIAAGDDLQDIVFSEYLHDTVYDMVSLLDRERNLYTYELPMQESPYGERWLTVSLGTKTDNLDLDPDYIIAVLFPDEAAILEMAEARREDGITVTWEYADGDEPAEAEPKTADILYVIDQYGEPVPGVMVNFCTDEVCMPAFSDENGVAACTGGPEDYHVQILVVPEGYSFNPEFEMQTGAGYGEWVLVIRRN